eukprot:2553058-Pyramimonas_sp.AAC.1
MATTRRPPPTMTTGTLRSRRRTTAGRQGRRWNTEGLMKEAVHVERGIEEHTREVMMAWEDMRTR